MRTVTAETTASAFSGSSPYASLQHSTFVVERSTIPPHLAELPDSVLGARAVKVETEWPEEDFKQEEEAVARWGNYEVLTRPRTLAQGFWL